MGAVRPLGRRDREWWRELTMRSTLKNALLAGIASVALMCFPAAGFAQHGGGGGGGHAGGGGGGHASGGGVAHTVAILAEGRTGATVAAAEPRARMVMRAL